MPAHYCGFKDGAIVGVQKALLHIQFQLYFVFVTVCPLHNVKLLENECIQWS